MSNASPLATLGTKQGLLIVLKAAKKASRFVLRETARVSSARSLKANSTAVIMMGEKSSSTATFPSARRSPRKP
eukprot:3315089-Rhodomonas_salina.1